MYRNLLLTLATAGAVAGFSLPLAQPVTAQVAGENERSLLEQQEGVEPLTRGPLHEAFAEPVSAEVDAALVIAKEPPAAIEEVAPEYRPTGEEAQWIPGYWGWDDERDDFIWISGVYRVAPPGQRFVPGYWQQVDRGWQWIPGFWIAANTEELTYQDPPPASLEQGPSSPSPGDDYFYAAGYWNYANNGYQWQPGYWYPSYSNYMWIPPRYIYTPRGCIFAGGHWDWRFGMRGQAFAPVYMQRSFYGRPGFTYRPTIALNSNLLFANLFIRPNYNHYFFGDYYGNQYSRRNIVPAYAYHTRRGGYDPMMAYYSAYYRRQGQDFIGSQRDWHDRKVRDASQRPSQNWADLVQRNGRPGGANDRQNLIAQPIAQLAQGREGQTQFVKIDDRQRDQLSTRSKALREMARDRSQAEKLANREGAPNTRKPGEARDPKAKVELHGRMKLPPAMESRVTARVNPDDPNAPRGPGDVGRERGRDVPPPAQPDGANVREDLRKLPDNVTNPRPRPEGTRPEGPGTRPERPGARPEVPRERPNVPGVDTPRPGVDTPDVPGTRPEVPRERPNIPGTDTPRPGTDTPRPGTDTPRPGTDTPRPGTDTPRPAPGTDLPPGTRQQEPRTRPEVPRERPNVPGADTPRPGAGTPDVPGTRPDVPRTRPEVPRERPNIPGTDTPRPGVGAPGTDLPPGTRQQEPRTRPEVPRERPNVPGANTPRPETPRTEAPRTRPEVPRERPMTPATPRPETPRARPETPRAERPQPPARPATPPARPETPRAERPQPPARPATPPARPETPRVERPQPPARPATPPARPATPPARPATPPAAAPRPERQPRAERPQPPARPERPKPQPQPKAEKPPKEDKGKGKG